MLWMIKFSKVSTGCNFTGAHEIFKLYNIKELKSTILESTFRSPGASSSRASSTESLPTNGIIYIWIHPWIDFWKSIFDIYPQAQNKTNPYTSYKVLFAQGT